MLSEKKGSDKMLGDEVASTVVKATLEATQVTGKALLAFIKALQEAEKKETPKVKSGKQSLKSLNKHNAEIVAVPSNDTTAQAVVNKLRKYGVDFAAVKNKDAQIDIFFKSKDVEQINKAFTRVTEEMKRTPRTAVRE